jgi:hypothetical protein
MWLIRSKFGFFIPALPAEASPPSTVRTRCKRGLRTALEPPHKKGLQRRPFSKSLTVDDHFSIWLPVVVLLDNHGFIARFFPLLGDCRAILVAVAPVGFPTVTPAPPGPIPRRRPRHQKRLPAWAKPSAAMAAIINAFLIIFSSRSNCPAIHNNRRTQVARTPNGQRNLARLNRALYSPSRGQADRPRRSCSFRPNPASALVASASSTCCLRRFNCA